MSAAKASTDQGEGDGVSDGVEKSEGATGEHIESAADTPSAAPAAAKAPKAEESSKRKEWAPWVVATSAVLQATATVVLVLLTKEYADLTRQLVINETKPVVTIATPSTRNLENDGVQLVSKVLAAGGSAEGVRVRASVLCAPLNNISQLKSSEILKEDFGGQLERIAPGSNRSIERVLKADLAKCLRAAQSADAKVFAFVTTCVEFKDPSIGDLRVERDTAFYNRRAQQWGDLQHEPLVHAISKAVGDDPDAGRCWGGASAGSAEQELSR